MKRYVVAIYNPEDDTNSIQVLMAETPTVAIVESMANVIGESEQEDDATLNLEALNEILHNLEDYEAIKSELEITFGVSISAPVSIHAI